MPIPTIDDLPDPPVRGVDTQQDFSDKVDALHQAYGPWVAALNAAFPELVAAATVANMIATSTSSVAIGTGSKSFTVESGKMLVGGMYIVIADAAAPTTNFMWGQVTSYNFETGALVFESAAATGSGTKTSWIVGLSGPQGVQGGSQLISPAFTGTPFEDAYPIVDGAAFAIDPANGSWQYVTLGANRTPTSTIGSGQSILLMVDDGSAYTITWSSIGVTWLTDGGAAPTLKTSGYTPIILFKLGSTVFGARVGNA